MSKFKIVLTLGAAATILSTGAFGAAFAVPMAPEVRDGIGAYKKGDYKSAVMNFTGALNTEFNNAVVHYYLGNCFIKLNQPESAIREFRIAYALAPDAEVGKFSKEALKVFGIDSDAGSAPMDDFASPMSKPKAAPKANPALDQAINSLRKQTFFAKDNESRKNEILSRDAEKRNEERLQRAKEEAERNSVRYGRNGRIVQTPMSNESKKMLDDLKTQFDHELNARKKNLDAHRDELQRSASNLEDLLKEQHNAKSQGPKLKPEGTNLYTRNYDAQKSSATKPVPKVLPPADAEVRTKPRDDNPFN